MSGSRCGIHECETADDHADTGFDEVCDELIVVVVVAFVFLYDADSNGIVRGKCQWRWRKCEWTASIWSPAGTDKFGGDGIDGKQCGDYSAWNDHVVRVKEGNDFDIYERYIHGIT